MKIAIEAQRLFRKKKHGMDMVALELIRHLQQVDRKNEYVVFVKPDEDCAVLQESPNVKIVALAGGPYPSWEQIALPRAVKHYGCDMLHCTANTAPLNPGVPLVVTLHDIIFMEKSAWEIVSGEGSAYQRFGNLYRRTVVPRLMKKASTIVTVSDFEKDRIREWCGAATPEHLETVYNGVSDYFRPVTDPKMQQRAKDRYRLPENYFFFLGNTHPKKNTIGVLKAFSEYRKLKSSDTKLLMLDYDREELQRLLRSIDDPGLASEILLTGYVDNRDLPAIYSLARIFLYPSLRESFGIPIIEAMACGVPVITSNTSSMPEVAGGAALLIDPFHPDELSQALIRLDQDEALRSSLSEKGLKRAVEFSWKHAAERMLDIYEHTN